MTPTLIQICRIPIYPPTNGRAIRNWRTARKLSEFGETWIATPGKMRDPPDSSDIRFAHLRNPFLAHKVGYIHTWNAFMTIGRDNPYDRLQTRATLTSLSGLEIDPDLIVCESPQLFRAGLRLADTHNTAFLIDMHNAHFRILEQFLASAPVPSLIARRGVANLRAFEQYGINNADAVVFQSSEDRELFDHPDDTVVETIPNGTDFETIQQGGESDRLAADLGIDTDKYICIFVGSYDYVSNREAAKLIIEEIAPELSSVGFLLVGRNPPETTAENVYSPGFVDDLSSALELADIALCPMASGSGTKLKVMDYLAAGLPIITTERGGDGIDLEDGESALIRDTDEFVAAIQELMESPGLRSCLSSNAQTLGKQYAWNELLSRYDTILEELIPST